MVNVTKNKHKLLKSKGEWMPIPNELEVRFDGGCAPTNPGMKYGSYSVRFKGKIVLRVLRSQFGRGTSNEAEFDALALALKDTISSLEHEGREPSEFSVSIFSDSTILVHRISGRNKKGKTEASNRMARYADICRNMLSRFLESRIKWEPRHKNVLEFGH
jgi:ribonuclease HI